MKSVRKITAYLYFVGYLVFPVFKKQNRAARLSRGGYRRIYRRRVTFSVVRNRAEIGELQNFKLLLRTLSLFADENLLCPRPSVFASGSVRKPEINVISGDLIRKHGVFMIFFRLGHNKLKNVYRLVVHVYFRLRVPSRKRVSEKPHTLILFAVA